MKTEPVKHKAQVVLDVFTAGANKIRSLVHWIGQAIPYWSTKSMAESVQYWNNKAFLYSRLQSISQYSTSSE